MAVKHSPQTSVQPEPKKKPEPGKKPEPKKKPQQDKQPEKITAPIFLDSESLAIPILKQLQANGELTPGAIAPPMLPELAEKIYGDMVYTRLLDERMVGAQRQGRLSFYLTCAGEEASIAGTIAAFQPEDMVMAQYREQLALRFRGFTTEQFMDQLLVMLRTSARVGRCRFTMAVASSTL